MFILILFIILVIVILIIFKHYTNAADKENSQHIDEPKFRPLNINAVQSSGTQHLNTIQNDVKHKEYMSDSNNPKWHRNEDEKNKFSNFYIKYSSIIKDYESKIYNNGKMWDNKISVDERISACRVSISAYNSLRIFCYEHGGEIYFQDMWEHCHNSREDCFSYGEKIQQQLEYLIKHHDDLLYVEANKPTLRHELIEYLKQHESVIQKDIYKDFNPLLKSSIQSELYFMEKEGIIKRTKKGSSYIIEI